MDWIDVEERLPDKKRIIAYGVRHYLRHSKEEYEALIVNYLDWKKAFFTDTGGLFLASHWMDKPNDPKKTSLILTLRDKIGIIAQELREKDLSYQKIAEQLNKMGYHNVVGNPFTHGNVWTLLGKGRIKPQRR